MGSVARYFISKFVQETSFSSFPFGTFVVNIIGCLLIGFIIGIAEKGTWMTPEWRLFLMVGLCGGFTTFSTFASENLGMLRDGQFNYVLIYTTMSVLIGFTAVFIGHIASKIL